MVFSGMRPRAPRWPCTSNFGIYVWAKAAPVNRKQNKNFMLQDNTGDQQSRNKKFTQTRNGNLNYLFQDHHSITKQISPAARNKQPQPLLLVNHHPHAAPPSATAHWVKVFIQCIRKAYHVIPAQVIHYLLLYIVFSGRLGNAIALV